jgi:hypothetical protein
MTTSQLWEALTPAQGSVISGVFTFFAAVSGVVLGWLLFSSRVKNLESAIKTSETVVKTRIDIVEKSLAAYESRLNEQLESFTLRLGQLGGSIADLPEPSQTSQPEQAARDALQQDWIKIRDKLEQIAANRELDGRRRAKYSRIDRRKYLDLVDAMQLDGVLGSDESIYREAVQLWQKFRSGRSAPGQDEIAKMQALWGRLNGTA